MEEVPLAASLTMAIAMFAAAVITWQIAQRTEAGTLGRNGMAGIRTKATLASDEAWIAGHKAAAPATRVASVISALTSVGFLATSGRGELTILVLIVGIALLLGAMAKAVIFANQAARDTAVKPANST